MRGRSGRRRSGREDGRGRHGQRGRTVERIGGLRRRHSLQCLAAVDSRLGMHHDILAAVLDIDRREIGVGDEQAAEHAIACPCAASDLGLVMIP